MATLRFLLKRFIAQRGLGLAVVVTLAFSIGVMVAGPIYADAAREAIVSSALSTADVTVVNTRFSVYAEAGFDLAGADSSITSLTGTIPLTALVRQGRGPVVIGADTATYQTNAIFREGAEDHLPAFRGRAPRVGEIALPATLAIDLNARIGDEVVISGTADARPVRLLVTATFSTPEAGDPFWFGSKSPFAEPDSAQPIPVLMSRGGYFDIWNELGTTTEFVWDAYIDLSQLTFTEANDLPAAARRITDQLRTHPGLETLQAAHGLDTLLVVVRQRIENLRVPIFLVVFQIGAVTLAVLAGVGSLTLTRQAFELAVLHSRGLSRRILLLAQAAQAALMAALSYPLGLLLGLGLAKLGSGSNGPTLPGTLFPVRMNANAELLGLIVAVVGAAILLLLSVPHVRRTVLEQRRTVSREDRPPLLRLPIELFLLPVGIFSFIQLRAQGKPKPGAGTIDPLVLLAPTLLIFACSFLALRLLMVGLRAADRAIGRSRSLSRYLAFRRLGRAPGIGFAAALLLLLSIGLLVVSTSYRAIALRSHQDGAHQIVGGDWRIQVASPDQPIRAIAAMPPSTTPLVRTQPFFQSGRFSDVPIALAIDPATFSDGGWWRSDYSTTSLDRLLDGLRTDPFGIELPPEAGGMTVEMTAPSQAAGLVMAATFELGDRTIITSEAGVVRSGSHTYGFDAAGANRLLSISLADPVGGELPSSLDLEIGPIFAGGQEISTDAFTPMTWRGSGGDLRGGSFQLSPGLGEVVGGLVPVSSPLPVIASTSVAEQLGEGFPVTLGAQQFRTVTIAVAESFPTVSPGGAFIVVPADYLLERAAAIPEAGLALNEVWANGETDPLPALERAGFIPGTVEQTAPIVGSLAQLPQSLAVGLEFTSAAAGLGLVIIGVAVGLAVSQRRRDFEFAAMRAMGAEPSHLRRALIMEQTVLLGFSVAAGLAVGYLMLKLMLPYFGRDIGVAFPEPILVVDGRALVVSVIAIVVATSFSSWLSLRSLMRSSVTGVLRGEAE